MLLEHFVGDSSRDKKSSPLTLSVFSTGSGGSTIPSDSLTCRSDRPRTRVWGDIP